MDSLLHTCNQNAVKTISKGESAPKEKAKIISSAEKVMASVLKQLWPHIYRLSRKK